METPASPQLQKIWFNRGVVLADAAFIVARNDDCSSLMNDEASIPVSVGILAMIYKITDDEAAKAVKHWLRRPDEIN